MSDKELNKDKVEEQFNKSEIDIYYIINVLWRYKIFITIFTFVIAVTSIIYVLTTTRYYMSSISIYPITKDQGGPLKEIAVSLGLGVKPDGFYLPDVIFSRRVLKRVINKKYKTEAFKDSVNLIQFWKLDKLELSKNRIMDAALYRLKNSMSLREDKETTLITLKAITKEKYLSADIVQSFIDNVTYYLQNELRTKITDSIIFTSERLVQVRVELLEKEHDLLVFKEKNAKLVSPYLSQEHGRKLKAINLIHGVEVLLKKQLELLKIEEVRAKPVMNVLDKPDIYEKHIRPKGRNIVITSTTMAFLISFGLCLLKEKLQRDDIFRNLKESIGIR